MPWRQDPLLVHIYGITLNTAKSADQYHSSYSYQSSWCIMTCIMIVSHMNRLENFSQSPCTVPSCRYSLTLIVLHPPGWDCVAVCIPGQDWGQLHNINSKSNSNSRGFNSNSNSGKSPEYQLQLQLQLRRFQLQLQFQLRQISRISTPTPTPGVSTPTPTPANLQNINSNSNSRDFNSNSNSNSGVSNPTPTLFQIQSNLFN